MMLFWAIGKVYCFSWEIGVVALVYLIGYKLFDFLRGSLSRSVILTNFIWGFVLGEVGETELNTVYLAFYFYTFGIFLYLSLYFRFI